MSQHAVRAPESAEVPGERQEEGLSSIPEGFLVPTWYFVSNAHRLTSRFLLSLRTLPGNVSVLVPKSPSAVVVVVVVHPPEVTLYYFFPLSIVFCKQLVGDRHKLTSHHCCILLETCALATGIDTLGHKTEREN